MDEQESQEKDNPYNSTNNGPSYPDPTRSSQTPYPAAPNSAYPTFPGSVYGASSGYIPLTYGLPAGRPPNALPSGFRSYASTPIQSTAAATVPHVWDQQPYSLPTPPSFSTSPPSRPLTETRRLAEEFHVRHGDPGNNPVYTPWPQRSQVEGGESRSHLAGIYQDDIGGKAAARRAWQAAITYGGQFEYDPDFEQSSRERGPELSRLFEEADINYVKPRGGPRIRAGKGRGGWRKLLKGTEHEKVGLKEKAPRTRGTGSARGRRPRKPVDPGPGFKRYLHLANKAFVEDDMEEAADNARQAVLANPEVYQAHALLAQILSKQGRDEDAIGALEYGMTTLREPEALMSVADRMLEFAGDRREKSLLRKVTDSYTQALKLKPSPEVALQLHTRVLELFDELDDARNCRTHCRTVLRMYPEKTEYIRRYAVFCAKWQDPIEMIKAREYYEKAFEFYKDDEDFGDEEDPTDPWSHLNIYLELVELVGLAPIEGIANCKRLARWFLGRKDEIFWDKYVEDDREFDDDNARRNYVSEFQQGRASRDLSKYGEGLPVDIRVRMGLLRIKMGFQFYDEAMRHFRPLLQYVDSIDDYYDMFLQVASGLRGSGFLKEAVEFYDPVCKVSGADDPDHGLGERVWMNIGTSYQLLERTDEAITCFENVTKRKGDQYVRACARLAKLYEDKEDMDKARFLCNELITLNRRDLLYEAKVKMVPFLPKINKPLPPSLKVPLPSAESQRAKEAFVPARQRHPVKGVLPAIAPSTVGGASLGPMSRAVVIPPIVNTPKKKPRANKKRGRGLPPNQCGDEDELDDEDMEEDSSVKIKRPRLRRKQEKKPATPKLTQTLQKLQDAETRALENYRIAQTYWPALKSGTDEEAVEQWTAAAHGMLDDFISMKVFFPERDRHLKLQEDEGSGRMLKYPKAETSIPKQFLSISFKEWHHVFVDLALIYAKNGEQDRCYRIVQEVLFGANVFYQNPEISQISYGIGIHVGLAFNDSQYLIQLTRQMIAETHMRNSLPFQLLAGVNRFTYGSNWFSSGPLQKFTLRTVKQNDFMSMPDEARNKVDWAAQASGLAGRREKYGAEKEPDAQLLTMYGHMVAVANHSHSALPYYYRALALQPDNICINLSIATMWIQNSMKRQTSNRHHGINQGLAFMYRYYDLRVASGKVSHRQEAEYNVARMWHYIGLTHLAMPAYEKVLRLSEDVRNEVGEDGGPLEYDVEDYALEAAFALQQLYAVVGNDEAARAITEEWLVI